MGANTTALRRSLPASHMLVSQLASNSPLEHYTPNIRIQLTLEHSSPISINNTHLSRRSHYLLIIIQLIN